MHFDKEHLDTIRKAPVFSALADKQLRDLLAQCDTLKFVAEQQIFRPTQAADRFYVVLSGQVKIFKLSARGDEQILHMYGPGETFGEAAMWAGIHYPAHAQAQCDTRVVVVSRGTLRRAFETNAELAMGMLAGMSGKLREFATLIEHLSLKEVPARLAAILLKEARACGAANFTLSGTKRELASRIGTVPETLSRAFAKLKSQGLIHVNGSQIRIRDMEGLQELAENG